MKISHYNVLISDPYPEISAASTLDKISVDLELPDTAEILFEEGAVAEKWPSKSQCKLKTRFKSPKDPNFLFGPGYIAVSKILKDHLIKIDDCPVEYLKTSIVNHQNEVLIPEMYILKPLTVLEGINFESSEFTFDEFGKIKTCKKLVLYANKSFSKYMFIKLKEWPHCILINRWRFIDDINWLSSYYSFPFTCAAFATGKIKREKSFPEPGVEMIVCKTLEKTSEDIVYTPEFKMSSANINKQEFSNLICDEFDLSSEWTSNSELFSGSLDDLIKHVKKAIKKYRY